eukprot:TRINITY_DN2014_c0_g5_i3.p1 TRINITY_DN2014_c0_g5~~TRINITY_DN2014_c0_g5_i3.p1  ORF type:complete len:277 (-),score=38.12 TRINITY_DN2014_c0_g5_i3:275-1105(-)
MCIRDRLYKEQNSVQKLLDDKFERDAILKNKCNPVFDVYVGNKLGQKYTDCSELGFMTDSENDEIKNIQIKRTKQYAKAMNIMTDCKEEYKSPALIIGRVEEWRNKYPQDVLDTNKIMCTVLNSILPFFRLDFLGFDPLGLTEDSFKYNGMVEFDSLEIWEMLKHCHSLCTENDPRNLYGEETIVEIMENRIKCIVRYLWDPFSRNASERIAKVVKNFNNYVCKQLEQNKLEHVKSILKEVLRALNVSVKTLKLTEKRSEYAERTMWRLLKVGVTM